MVSSKQFRSAKPNRYVNVLNIWIGGLLIICVFYLISLSHFDWGKLTNNEHAVNTNMMHVNRQMDTFMKEVKDVVSSELRKDSTEKAKVVTEFKGTIPTLEKLNENDMPKMIETVEETLMLTTHGATTIPLVITDKPEMLQKVNEKNVSTQETPRMEPKNIKKEEQQQKLYFSSYDIMKKYIESYNGTTSLFLFFNCDRDQPNNKHWSTECDEAYVTVHSVFDKALKTNENPMQLVTVSVGPEVKFKISPFRSDFDLKLARVPTVLRYDGNGKTSSILDGKAAFNKDLLNYIFHNQTEENLMRKEVIHIKDRKEYDYIVNSFQDDNPLYLFYVSGRHVSNNRPWCPWCRFKELAVEYLFHKYAAKTARLAIVEVSQTYAGWKKTDNPYRVDIKLFNAGLRGVPFLAVCHRDVTNELFYQSFKAALDDMEAMQKMFERDASMMDAEVEYIA